jgi:uncharacterized protein YkwD
MKMRIAAHLALAGSILVFGLAIAGLPFPRAQTAAAIANCDTNEADLNAAEFDLLAGINAERAKVGVAALNPSPTLNRSSAWKSADSSASGPGFSHTDSLGRPVSARAADCGYPWGAGENIAYGYSSAGATLAAWMSSTGHRANILNPVYRVIGIGQHGSAWTTDFGFVDDSNAAPPAPPTATRTPTTVPPSPTPQPVYTAAGIRMDLAAGISLVTYAGVERPASLALASLAGGLIAVYEWNAATGRWEKYIPGRPAYVSTFTTLKPGHVYSLELAAPGTWVY